MKLFPIYKEPSLVFLTSIHSSQEVYLLLKNEDLGLLDKDHVVMKIVSYSQGTMPSISHVDSSQEVDAIMKNEDLRLLVKDRVITKIVSNS